MKSILTITIILLVLLGGYFYIYGDRGSSDPVEVSTYVDSELGYRFEYDSSPEGYIILEDEEAHRAGFLQGHILFDKSEYEEFQQSTGPGEGPPAIHIRVYQNSQSQSPSVWAMSNSMETNYNLALSLPSEAVVGGANAVHFVADGLWPIDTYVVAHNSRIYLIIGMIPNESVEMKADFLDLVESFEFVQTAGEQ